MFSKTGEVIAMRICMIISVPLPPEEGIGHHVWNLAKQLIRQGHEVGIITRGSLAQTVEEQIEGVAVWRPTFAPIYPFHVHFHAYFVNRLIKEVEGNFDIINAHTPLPPAVKTRLPVVTTVHSPMLADTAATQGWDLRTLALRGATPVVRRIEKALFDRSEKITAVAAWVAQALELYGVEPSEVAITGNGVETSFFEAPLNEDRKPYVLYVGRLDIGKGIEELIEAAEFIVENCPDLDLRFVLVGKGPLLPKLSNLVTQKGLEGTVEFRGHLGADRRDELIELYRDASVFVLPSHHEGMPTVLLEAMATGTPAISTAVGGALEVGVDGENVLLVPARDAQVLANSIIRLLTDRELGAKLGRNARQTVQSLYSWPAITQHYLASYEQALQDQGMQ
jgi:glycosyltransferase involved in cell wall biosynthesis